MENKITSVLFDLGGVVLNLDYQRTIQAFKSLGGSDFEARYSKAAQSDLFDLFETGKIDENEFRLGICKMLGKQVSDAEIDAAWNAMLLDLPFERIRFLKELSKNYPVYLFSNTNAIHLRKFQEIIEKEHGNAHLLETIFHKTYYSHLIGLRKPHVEAFQYILEDQNLQANEVLFIDDSLQHIQGASSIGIQAHHMENTDLISFCKTLFS